MLTLITYARGDVTKSITFPTISDPPPLSLLTGVATFNTSLGPLPLGTAPPAVLFVSPNTPNVSSLLKTLFGHPVLVLSVPPCVLFGVRSGVALVAINGTATTAAAVVSATAVTSGTPTTTAVAVASKAVTSDALLPTLGFPPAGVMIGVTTPAG